MTIFEAYNQTKQKLEKAGIEDYVFEAKQIIKHITGFSSVQILNNYNHQLTPFQQNNLTAILRQREIRYPLQYIFGTWDFYGRPFYVGPGVLVPRADTETAVDVALKFLKDCEEPTVLDLCAGSGCIGISIALEKPEATVTLLEKYDEALTFAEKNIRLNEAVNTTAVKGDIFAGDGAENKYDLIISNPPYIPKNEKHLMSPETGFEPETALMAEDDGLEFYKAIIKNYADSLSDGGMICFEVGMGKADKVKELLKNANFVNIKTENDLSGTERVVYAIKGKEE